MELRQLRYFVNVVELGSMGRAALELGIGTSAVSQQISRLEGELCTRLLQRSSTGVVPTDAGLAFLRQAQLALRHADDAVKAAKQARLSGHVSIGLAPSTSAMLAVPLLLEMRARYPEIRVHLVEALSGNLAAMLDTRRLDLAVVFRSDAARGWSATPLLDERLFVIGSEKLGGMPKGASVTITELLNLPMILPSATHSLRALVDATFARCEVEPRVLAEIDGLAPLMDAVRAGLGATLQPGAALARPWGAPLRSVELTEPGAHRPNLLASLSDDDLSPAGLAARVTLTNVARALVRDGRWIGASLYE